MWVCACAYIRACGKSFPWEMSPGLKWETWRKQVEEPVVWTLKCVTRTLRHDYKFLDSHPLQMKLVLLQSLLTTGAGGSEAQWTPRFMLLFFSNQFTALSCVAHISPRLHCVGLPLGVSQFPKSMIRFDFWFQGHDSIFKPYRISFCKDHQIIGFISWQLSFTCSSVSSKR